MISLHCILLTEVFVRIIFLRIIPYWVGKENFSKRWKISKKEMNRISTSSWKVDSRKVQEVRTRITAMQWLVLGKDSTEKKWTDSYFSTNHTFGTSLKTHFLLSFYLLPTRCDSSICRSILYPPNLCRLMQERHVIRRWNGNFYSFLKLSSEFRSDLEQIVHSHWIEVWQNLHAPAQI